MLPSCPAIAATIGGGHLIDEFPELFFGGHGRLFLREMRCDATDLTYSRQGERMGWLTRRLASSSPTICSVTGSNLSGRPQRKAALARW